MERQEHREPAARESRPRDLPVWLFVLALCLPLAGFAVGARDPIGWGLLLASLVASSCSALLGLRAASSAWVERRRVVAALGGLFAVLAACVVLVLLASLPTAGRVGDRAFFLAVKWSAVLGLLCAAPLLPVFLYLGARWTLVSRRRLHALAALACVTASVHAWLLVLSAEST